MSSGPAPSARKLTVVAAAAAGVVATACIGSAVSEDTTFSLLLDISERVKKIEVLDFD